MASGSGTSLLVDNPFGFTEATTSKLFRIGMVISVLDEVDGTEHINSAKITAITSSTGTLTHDSTYGSSADGDLVCREDVYSGAPASIGEIMGLDGLVSASNYPSPSTDQY